MSLDRRELPEHHLKYEIDMFFFGAKTLIDLGKSEKNTIEEIYLKNSRLESYLIHLRNIKDFLWDSLNLRYPNDILADTFCSSSCNRHSSGEVDLVAGLDISKLDTRINKQISHLTKQRTSKKDEQMEWNIKKITCDIAGYLLEYMAKCDKMDTEYRKSIKNEISDFKNHYCGISGNSYCEFSSAISTTSVSVTIPFSSSLVFQNLSSIL